jgi:hypothetical protein
MHEPALRCLAMTDEDEQATDSVTPPDASLLLDDLDEKCWVWPRSCSPAG